jgi:hypothetical protein
MSTALQLWCCVCMVALLSAQTAQHRVLLHDLQAAPPPQFHSNFLQTPGDSKDRNAQNLNVEPHALEPRTLAAHLHCIMEHIYAVHLSHHQNYWLGICTCCRCYTSCCCCCRCCCCQWGWQGWQSTPHAVSSQRLAVACCYAGAAVGGCVGCHGQLQAGVVLLLIGMLEPQTEGVTAQLCMDTAHRMHTVCTP